VRARAVTGATLALLAGPFALAFFQGGFFDRPRLVAAIAAWALVLVAAIAADRPLPASLPGRLALGSLAALTAWSALSLEWAPSAAGVVDDTGRLLLYLGALTAGTALLRGPLARRALEPALASGVLVVVLYGLSERLVPGLVELARSETAAGRLEQPLTYWNAMGGLAAIGAVLCARLAGDPARTRSLRATGAAAAVPLGLGVYMSFSRGALLAAVVGLLVLWLLAPAPGAQLRAVVVVAVGGCLVAGAAAALPATRTLGGGGRVWQGLALLAAVALVSALAAGVQARAPAGSPRPRRVLRPALALAAVLTAAVVVLAVGAAVERSPDGTPFGATSARFASAQSDRYGYWEVAARAFADHPLRGIGSGGFAVEWLRERDVPERVRDAHSLYAETAAELGLPGLLALAGLLGAVALAGRRVTRREPAVAVGALAGFVTWAVQAGLDWSWEMPALTLVALLLAAALLAWSDEPLSGSEGAHAT
jgi:hypothetical protein